MRKLAGLLAWVAAQWVFAGEPAPTIRTALDAADAATAEDLPLDTRGVDKNEAILRELEFRVDRMRSGREQMQQALVNMGSDPNFDPNTRKIFCSAAVSTLRAPEFFKLLRGKVKTLEKPKNIAQLTPDQVQRFENVKAAITGLQSAPDMDCSKI